MIAVAKAEQERKAERQNWLRAGGDQRQAVTGCPRPFGTGRPT